MKMVGLLLPGKVLDSTVLTSIKVSLEMKIERE